MACAPEAHAVMTAKFAAQIPNLIAICPGAAFAINLGIINGETLEGPFSSNILCCASISMMPPIPVPTIVPTLFLSILSRFSPESSTAVIDDATARLEE